MPMQVKQEGTMWQTPIKGDFLKRSLNQYQYQYPTPASVSRQFLCCCKLSLLPSKFTVVGYSANQCPKKVSRQLEQYWRTCSIGVKSDSGVKSDANTLYWSKKDEKFPPHPPSTDLCQQIVSDLLILLQRYLKRVVVLFVGN